MQMRGFARVADTQAAVMSIYSQKILTSIVCLLSVHYCNERDVCEAG